MTGDAPDRGSAAPPIRVTGLRTEFGDTLIHDDLNLDVKAGEILGLVGGSGSGKSVLLNTILGLKTPDAGKVELFGHDIQEGGERDEVERRIGKDLSRSPRGRGTDLPKTRIVAV